MARPRHSFGQQPGRLVATMLRALAAELADPGRYSRAKTYARDGAVIEIDVRPGVVSGLVLGSRRDPYEVLVTADSVPDHEIERANVDSISSMTLMIPGRDELSVACSCPDADGGQLCKHAVALLLVLADEVSIEPELLVRWRTPSDDALIPADTVRVVRRGRSPSGPVETAGAKLRAVPALPVTRIDVLAGLLDAPSPIPSLGRVARVEAPTPPAAALNDSTRMLLHRLTTSALAAITRR